jgi:putative ABC transport system permease protein
MKAPSTALQIACADLWFERRLALCTVLGMAAVLAPLVVLAGLRAGIVEGVREALLEDPHGREIRSAGNRDYSISELGKIAARPDVLFLMPRTRWTIPDVPVWTAPRPTDEPVEARLIASAPGDPLLAPGGGPASFDATVLSTTAAAKLHAEAGTELVTIITRSSREKGRETVQLHLRVQGIAKPAAFSDAAAFVSLDFAAFKEDYQDFLVDAPPAGQLPPQHARAAYAGFRLYAAKLEGVPALAQALNEQGIDLDSDADKVANLLAVDRSLRLLLMLVAGLGGSGYLLALGATLWAGVERRRPALAMLRFLGMRAAALTAVPVLQSVILALLGWMLALAPAQATAVTINHLFAGTVGLDRPLCRITGIIVLGALGLTIAGSILAASAAGARLRRIEPWEGIIAQS